jgi:3-deoxy-D-manno-octulosonate 8-phosphate phosphatase (KDO 8-P phosphatase)
MTRLAPAEGHPGTMEGMGKPDLAHITVLLLDVDGVLTAGEVIYNDQGQETKVFNVRDGLGIRMLQLAGIQVGLITGRRSKALKKRCRNLGIGLLKDNVRNKISALDEIVAQINIPLDCMAYMGDDLPDLAVMSRVAVSIAVSDAHELVRQCADIVTQAAGGRGAVREICEQILKAQGHWEPLMKKLFSQ